jgi:asparagine synthase (glutamine-hydrolysing)
VRWFGGCAPGGAAVVPAGARLIWKDPPLWTSGNWSTRSVRTLAKGSDRLAVFGPCSADDAQLVRALVSADLSAFGGVWAGAHTIVRARAAGISEVLTDATAACPVYTVRVRDGVVWGSSSWALSALTGGRVDSDWLAEYLIDTQTGMFGRSAWTGVQLLPAGHRVLMRRGGVAQVSSWHRASRRSRAEAVVLLRDALAEGVRARVVGVPCSSDVAGLDSSALVLLASRLGPVLGMTVHPAGVCEGGDVTYARVLAEALPQLQHLLFPLAERHLPLTLCEEVLPATDEPAPSTVTWARFSAQLRALARFGISCHLTGDGGDTLFLPPPTHLADLVRARKWCRLVADAQRWALLRRVSPWGLLKAAVRKDRHTIVGGGGQPPPWLRTTPAQQPSAPTAAGSADAMLLAEVRYVARSARTEQQLADLFGIELHNPYLDSRVLDAVLSVPSWERVSAARYKPLLVDAVGPLLPSANRRRSTKGVFVGEFHRGMRMRLPRLLALADGRLAGLGLIEPGPLRAAMHAAALGAETAWPALLPTLNAELWLAVAETTPTPRWYTCAEPDR